MEILRRITGFLNCRKFTQNLSMLVVDFVIPIQMCDLLLEKQWANNVFLHRKNVGEL